MATGSFRELNQLRRQQNAFVHLRDYALAKGIADAEEAARRAAETMHPVQGEAAASTDAQPARSRPRATRKETAAEEAPAIPHRLEDRTKEQLYARAQELEIEGRSQMTKEELIEAIRAAR